MLSRQHVSVRCVYAADFSPFFSGVGWEGGGGGVNDTDDDA